MISVPGPIGEGVFMDGVKDSGKSVLLWSVFGRRERGK